ncbi:hypothetical protein [Streptomyces aureocirculatus]|uniref:hypothetical protein n=1 Tax=Streptomyces aureocirculatus TaxID=67275 RepID=UPI0012FF2B81|nr:hypothetical protein [Streptomyces aureocirculatus]
MKAGIEGGATSAEGIAKFQYSSTTEVTHSSGQTLTQEATFVVKEGHEARLRVKFNGGTYYGFVVTKPDTDGHYRMWPAHVAVKTPGEDAEEIHRPFGDEADCSDKNKRISEGRHT